MEPADLNHPNSSDETLEALRRRPPPGLPDAGFSARVLAALPPPGRRSPDWRQILLCAGGAAAGAAVALATGHPLRFESPNSGAMAAAAQAAVVSLSQPANALTLVIVVAAIAYALWREEIAAALAD